MRFVSIFLLIISQYAMGAGLLTEFEQTVRCFTLEKQGQKPGVLIGTNHVVSYKKILSPGLQKIFEGFKHFITEKSFDDTSKDSDTEECESERTTELNRLFRGLFTNDQLPPEAQAIYNNFSDSLPQCGLKLCNAHKSLADWSPIADFLQKYPPKNVCEFTFDSLVASEISAYRSLEAIDSYIMLLGWNTSAQNYSLETEAIRKKACELADSSGFPCLDLKIEEDPYHEALLWYSGICALYLFANHSAEFKEFIAQIKEGELTQRLPFLVQEGNSLRALMVDKDNARVRDYYFDDRTALGAPDMIYRNRQWKHEIPKILQQVAGESFVIAAGASHLNVFDLTKNEQLGLIAIFEAMGYTVTAMERNVDGLFDVPSSIDAIKEKAST